MIRSLDGKVEFKKHDHTAWWKPNWGIKHTPMIKDDSSNSNETQGWWKGSAKNIQRKTRSRSIKKDENKTSAKADRSKDPKPKPGSK